MHEMFGDSSIITSQPIANMACSALPCMANMLQIVPSGSKERLAFVARQMDVDILVTGHTHEFKVGGAELLRTCRECLDQLAIWCVERVLMLAQADCVGGRLLINPGSATGAFHNLHQDVIPSFVLMDISGKKVMGRLQ